MLSDRCLSCVCPVLSVTLVCCGQTVGRKMKLGVQVGLGPGHIVLGGNPAAPPPIGYIPHFCCGQMAAWIKMPLGMELGLGPGDFVLDGNPALPSPRKGQNPCPLSNFRPISNCGQTTACINMPLGTEVGLSPGDFVLDGNPAP